METMIQEDKELLIKDLCARLPYGVKMNHIADDEINPLILIGIARSMITLAGNGGFASVDIEEYKPYLFPLSSMTEEQKKEFLSVAGYEAREEDCGRHTETYYYDMVGHEHNFYPNIDAIDWLNKNKFDYRGLIPKGLALDATKQNVY